MKLLIIFNHPAPYKVRMFNELAKLVDLTVIFERNKARDRNDNFYVENKYNFNCIILHDGYFGNEGSFSNGVKKYIKLHHSEFDFIIMNGYSHIAEIKAINYMQKHKIAYGLMVNGGFIKPKESLFKKNYKTRLISKSALFLSPTIKTDDYLIYYGANKNNIYRYAYSNISENDLLSKNINKLVVRNKYKIPTSKKVFINCSQFIDRKNNLELLKCFINSKHYLVLVGEGKQRKDLIKFIETNNMDNVMLIPFKKRDELFELLQSCDAYITLAKEDIFGQTTIEALANGLPVISSNKINSSLEYIKEGYNGYIVDLNNLQQICNSIENVLDLPRKNAILSVKDITFEQGAKQIASTLETVKK